MPSVFQSHPNRDEPQRLTTVASRTSEDIALRPRRERDISVLYNQNNTSTPEELAFQLNDLPPTRTSPARVSVSVNSILANSTHSSGEDVAPPVLEPVPSSQLRTSTFTNLASQLLNRASTSSSSSSNATYDQAPTAFDRSIIGSPEFDKISVDSAPIACAPATAAASDNGRVGGLSDSSLGPSASGRPVHGNFQERPVRARLSSDMSSLQHEMENNAYTTNSPVSEATYMQMRKTLDPEALLNGDMRAGTAVLGSLRPIANPFSVAHEDADFHSFQRRRAATTGTAPTAGPTFGAPTSFRIPGGNRSQRSWTVPGNRLSSIPAAAPVLLANDPRGTFRTTTADTTQQIFAAQQVRLQNKWQTDVWIYMKNSHPFLGICTAHRWHPYKKQDRILVLVVTLLLTVLLCGIYATQDCCKTSLDSSVAVVSSSTGHRLLSQEYFQPPVSNQHQPAATRMLSEELNCQPFGAKCGSSSSSLCTLGSTCLNSTCVANQPNTSATMCTTNAQCPLGWRCSTASQRCRPSTSLVCYLPVDQTKSKSVAFALTEDEETTNTPTTASSGSGSSGESAPVDAISALANLLKYAKDNNITTDGSTVVIPSQTPAPTLTPTPAPTPKLGSNSTTPAKNQTTNASGDSGSGSDETVATATPAPSKAAADDAFEVEKLLITLTKPTNGGVYGVSATIPIAWEVKLLQGQRSFVNALKFRVDFSHDGKTFDVVLASNIATDTPASTATNTTQYHFDWNLAKNESLTCTDCVLRVCTQSEDSSVDPVCIRTDGATTSTSTRSNGELTAAAASSTQPKITFHIVREIIECSCGLQNVSFVTYAYLIALVFPIAFLVLEQFVTFYQDSKVFGMFARRGGPKMPVVGFYAAEATKRGRIVLGWLLLGLVFGCGMVGARITSDHFLGSTGDITVLWLVMFLLVLVVGFIYTSIVYIVLFTMRWNQDKAQLNQPGDFADLNDFGGMMFLDNHDQQGGLSYQWPPPQSIPTNSSRSNGVTDSSRSTAVVTQQPGLAIV